MLFDRKSVTTGMSPHPRVRCVLPFVDLARWLPACPFIHALTITFQSVPDIQSIAGGFYGDEFRPD